MTNILITGGGGYIGSHVCHLLIDQGYDITCIDSLITENKEIPDNSLVVGSPGKVVREVTEEEKKAVFKNTKHYQDNWKKYSKSIF